MTPEKLREAAAVMIAAAEGKAIQLKAAKSAEVWLATSTPVFDWSSYEYRVWPGKIVLYANVYGASAQLVGVHATRADADGAAKPERIARVRIEFEEGQFDN